MPWNKFWGLDGSLVMKRKTRLMLDGLNFAQRKGLKFKDGGEGGGGAGGAGAGGGSGAAAGKKEGEGQGDGGGADDDDDQAGDRVSRAELKKTVGQRDRYKGALNALATDLGLELEWETDEDTNQRKPKFKGLDALKEARKASEGAGGKKKDGDKLEDREAELNRLHTEKVQKLNGKAERRQKSLSNLLTNFAVEAPLKAALAAEGAYDDPDSKGEYRELVKLLTNNVRVEIDFDEDEEDEPAKLKVGVVDDDGKLLSDGRGTPKSIRDFVKEYLDKRPHLKKPDFRRGSGAGGHGGAGGQGGRTGTVKDHAVAAAGSLFGKKQSA